ncbi:MGDG synthase family glycosyltransferase [Inconstantimicrobium porci]|uniref:UDP-N-acetylglucosamine--LPS N-acetylglucosamine transferase n=1 Tax=Inconstantimicrobium porci TaxID=2652291 RepID=A0A7X2T173_9CLOT|nr:glycosyltransferase [Inconstantimicrobium porci]MDD6770798.1 glycosyltransferase [Inconstantimicrobium porci]MSR90930.1 UDP-N-acetylglucosamine--LPS N-acetylglucosamine transferase [Inconstantimicrobium porci]
MKKVIILTTSTGQGHNQAAASLKTEFIKNNYDVEIFDFLDGCSHYLDKLITGSYEFSATKTPILYGIGYKITDIKFINSFLKIPFGIIDKRLAKHINDSQADIIIGTHPFTVNIVSRLKKKKLIDIPFISVVTDFEAHGTYISKQVDCYITGSDFTNDNLISKGIKPSKVKDYGIPIRSGFLTINNDITETNTGDYFNILLMSGSMGLEGISKVIKQLVLNPRKLRLIIVCGKNKHLKNSLEALYSKPINNKKIHIIGYSNVVSELMDASDVIISKPGGLTVTESIYKRLPIIIPFVIPGQETENSKLLVSRNCAVKIDKISDVNKIINDLIDHPEKLKKMKDNLDLLGANYSLKKVVELSNSLLKK